MTTNFLTPPRKAAGRRYAPQAKKPPDRATVSEFVLIWCDFTLKSEPISDKIPKAQPRRLRACNARSPRQKNSLPIFLFPPPNFFFETEKGVFWWWRLSVSILLQKYGVNSTIMTSIYARPKPNASLAWSFNPQRETARHEYFSLWSLLETAMGGSRAAARGGLFGSLHPFNKV